LSTKLGNKKGLIFTGVVISLILAGCGKASSNASSESSSAVSHKNQATSQVLNWTASTELPTVDSVKEYDVVSQEQIDYLGEGLYKIDSNNNAVPAVASGNPVAQNKAKTKYVINIKKGLKWSNGSKLTAQDFVYAWQRLFNPKTAAQNASVYYNIKNAEQINLGKKKVSSLGVKALSDTKLEITLERRDPYLKATLSSENLFPENEAFVKKAGSKYGTSSKYVLSNGPFVMKDWDGSGTTWHYVKNTKYHEKNQITLKRINIQVTKNTATGVNQFQAGKVDNALLSGYYVKQFKNDKRLKKVLQLRSDNLELGIHSNKKLQNLNFRKALSLSINRNQLVNDVLTDGSRAATSIVPKGLVKSPDGKTDLSDATGNLVKYNPTEAKKLWAKAQKELGTKKISLDLYVDDSSDGKNVGEYVQGKVQNTLKGVTLNIKQVPAKSRFQKLMSYKFDTALGGWSGNFDPYTFLQQFQTGFEHNHGKFSNKQYDNLLDKINGSDLDNLNTRWQDLIKSQKVLIDQQATIPLYQPASTYLISSKLKGVVTHNLGTPLDVTRAYLVK